MFRLEDVARMFESDWTVAHWIVCLSLVVGAFVLAWFGHAVVDFGDSGPFQLVVKWAAIVFFDAIFLIAPGAAMRHIQQQSATWWVIGIAIALGVALALRALSTDSLASLIGAACLGLGAIVGGIADAVTRMAASVPMTVTGFVLVVVIGVAAVIVWARRA